MKKPIVHEVIERMIFMIRGQRVMLDRDLARLYGVPVKRLNEQVKRNIKRFPGDFMFLLTRQEVMNLKSQIATSSWGGMKRANPYAFTEQGITMLSSVLRSKRAIQVNIVIMQAFVKLKQIMSMNKKLAHKLAELERKVGKQGVNIQAIFKAVRQLIKLRKKSKRMIEFHEYR